MLPVKQSDCYPQLTEVAPVPGTWARPQRFELVTRHRVARSDHEYIGSPRTPVSHIRLVAALVERGVASSSLLTLRFGFGVALGKMQFANDEGGDVLAIAGTGVEHWNCIDQLSFMQQLGVIPTQG